MDTKNTVLLSTLLADIANAIRDKDGSDVSDIIYPVDYPDRIRAIPQSEDVVLEELILVTPPTKTSYYYNGLRDAHIDVSGVSFVATLDIYGNSFSIDVPNEKVTYEPSDVIAPGTNSVVFTYRLGSQTAQDTHPITIEHLSPCWDDIEVNNFTWGTFEARFESWESLETC